MSSLHHKPLTAVSTETQFGFSVAAVNGSDGTERGRAISRIGVKNIGNGLGRKGAA